MACDRYLYICHRDWRIRAVKKTGGVAGPTFLLGRIETTTIMVVFLQNANSSPDSFWEFRLILAVAILLGIILFVYFYQNKKRKEELQRMALEIGFTSYPSIDSIPVDSRPEPLDFPYVTKDVGGVILHGKIDSVDVLIFDHARLEEGGEDSTTQTVACFCIDAKELRLRFPDRMFGRTEVEGWFVEFGAGGWLSVYRSGSA